MCRKRITFSREFQFFLMKLRGSVPSGGDIPPRKGRTSGSPARKRWERINAYIQAHPAFFFHYQTLHTLSAGLTIGCPGLQEKACANSDMFTTTPLMRYREGEWGSVMARTRRSSGRSFEQS